MIACPTDEDLAGHLAGELEVARSTAVAAHLDGCYACRAVVIGAVRGGVVSLAAVSDVTLTARGDARRSRNETLAPGTAIGRYRIKQLLGAGGMGVVYVAYDSALDRDVALKVLRPDLAGDPVHLAERLVRESRLMAKATHPAVITVHDVGRDDDQVFVAMELIHGETLGKWLRRAPRTVEDVIALFRRAGAGLAAAHRAGLVHRDFKPDNVLVELGRASSEEVTRVLVTDFGVARAVADDDRGAARPAGYDLHLTQTGVAVGTPAYMAPEQLSGEDVDERADVFGFAVALWEALYGVRPFPGKTPNDIRAAMQRLPVPPDERGEVAARGRVPSWVTKALLAALVADPGARTPTVNALLAALDPAPRTRRRRRALAALAGLVVVGGAGLAIAAWPSGSGAAADPCAIGLAELDHAWNPRRAVEAKAALTAKGADADLRDAAVGELDRLAHGWRDVHLQSCKAQPAAMAACLSARRIELAVTGAELHAATMAGTAHPTLLAKLVSEPEACLRDAPSLAAPNVPTDPALARAVSDLRGRLFTVEQQRDAGDYAGALAALAPLEATAQTLGWERVVAEVAYLRGATESVGGDTARGLETLRAAAVIAQRARHDTIAANVWIVLAHSTGLDMHDSARAFEYLDYADPAIERLGRPGDLRAQSLYTRGIIEVDLERYDDGEAHLREALAIAEAEAPEFVAIDLQGLAMLMEARGRFSEAADLYQRTLDMTIAAHGGEGHPEEVTYRSRLAYNLARGGKTEEAVTQAKLALVVAESTLDAKQIDRMHAHVTVADVLRIAGRTEESLPLVAKAVEMAKAIVGERSQTYGEVLLLQGELLNDVGRAKEALSVFERACANLEFTVDDDVTLALCWVNTAIALNALGRPTQAIERIEQYLPAIEAAGELGGAQLASAKVIHGDSLLLLRKDAAAAAQYEAARAMFAQSQIEPGFEASAEWGLAQAYARSDPARAVAYAEAAVKRWASTPGMWQRDRAQAEAWLAKRRKAKAPAPR
jgi:eukaryotic-like serine/threonine-protein kinase